MNPEQQENNSKRTSDELIPPRRDIRFYGFSSNNIFHETGITQCSLVNRNVKRATLYSEEETISRNVLVMSEFRHHQAMPQFLQERMPSDQNRELVI